MLALAAIAAPVAHAAFSYSSGNLYLGFRQVGNSTSDFAVSIGAAGTYRDALAPVTLTIGGLSSQLDSIFNTTGGAWKLDSNVKWGIFGTTSNTANNGDPIRVLYITEPIGQSQPIQQNTQTGFAGNMINTINYYSNGAASGTTSGLSESAFVTNGAVGNPVNANSVTTRLFTGVPFGTNNLSQGYDSVTNNLEFYRVPQGSTQTTVADKGSFNISGDTLTFTPTAVPEPSAYAFLFLGTVGMAYIGFNYFRKTETA